MEAREGCKAKGGPDQVELGLCSSGPRSNTQRTDSGGQAEARVGSLKIAGALSICEVQDALSATYIHRES